MAFTTILQSGKAEKVIQSDLWHDTILDALGAAVQAAGGIKKVGGRLWPALDETSATSRLRACLNPDHAMKLDLDELVLIGSLARAGGDISLLTYLGRVWSCEVKPIAAEKAKKQARSALRLSLLERLRQLEADE